MATSESDQSDKSMTVCGTKSNRATFFFQHVSDEEDISQSSEDTNTTYSSSCDDKNNKTILYSPLCDNALDVETCDQRNNKNTSLCFREDSGCTELRYSKAEISELVTEAERIVANHFMDISSPDIYEQGAVSCSSLETCSASEEFYSAHSDNLHANINAYRHLDTGSLFSFGLWDQDAYLSEHLYENPIVEEKVKELLEFGDDYHNCIGSISESQSVVNESVPSNCRRFRKRRRKKMAEEHVTSESDTDTDLEDASDLISSSYDKLDEIKERAENLFSGKNFKGENLQEYNEVTQLGSDYLQNLIPLLQSIKFDNSFSSNKKNCEIRCLLTQWTGVLHKIKDDINQKSINDRLEVETLNKNNPSDDEGELISEEMMKDQDAISSPCKESCDEQYETWLRSELVNVNENLDPWVVVDMVKQPVKVSWVKLG